MSSDSDPTAEDRAGHNPAGNDRTENDRSVREEFQALVRSARLVLEAERGAGLAVLPADDVEPIVAAAPERPAAAPRQSPRQSPRQPHAVRPAVAPARSREPAATTPPAGSGERTGQTTRPAPSFVPRVRALDLPAEVLAPFGELPPQVSACTRCPLGGERTHAVFGEGNPSARLVFCGEAPGYDEDRSGRPFVGRAGELLSAMIEKGMRLRREDVFILNAIKCRPPNNRTPSPDELAACRPYLEEQLRVIAPEVIVALGNPASRALLGDVPGITRIRGQIFEAFGARVVPTFHPAFLLRNPAAKADAWKDLQLVMRLLAES